jgi:hypothetical protein
MKELGWTAEEIGNLVIKTPRTVESLISDYIRHVRTAEIEANLARQAEEAEKERVRQEAERIKQETYEAYRTELRALQEKYPDHWDDTKDNIRDVDY